jgi:hypothetical protein
MASSCTSTDASKTEPKPGFAPPSTNLAALEHDIQNKAAMLKAKLLEKRASSRGANKPDKEGASSAFDRPVVDHHESDSALDKLVRDARAAAEVQAKQKEYPHQESVLRTNATESTAQRGSPVDSTPTLTPTDTAVQNPSKARKSGQKSSKQSKKAEKAELRAQQLQQQQEATQEISRTQSIILAKQAEMQNTEYSPRNVGNKVNALGPKEMNVETELGSIGEKKGSSPIASFNNPGANMPSRSETLLSTSTIQQGPSTALIAVGNSSTHVVADAGHDPVASYSHHFDDLDEWLEVTGYHDRGNRERTLSLHRRKAQLEREMADIDRELEQTVSSRTRSFRGLPLARQTSSSVSSMPPPPAPADPSTSGATQAVPQSGIATRAGEKRARSPEPSSNLQHSDKHQRTNSASKISKSNSSDRPMNSWNGLEIPSGPR